MKRVRPFPVERLPRVVRSVVESGRALLAHLPPCPGRLWPTVCEQLGGSIVIELAAAYATEVAEVRQLDLGVVVRLIGPASRPALLMLDGRLAPRIARWALGVGGVPELGAARPLTLAEQGALEFLVSALCDEQPLRVAGVLSRAEAEAVLARSTDDNWLVLEARVRSPAGNGWARLVAPDSLRVHTPPPPPQARLLTRLGRLDTAPVALSLEVGRTTLGRGDLLGLSHGDVILFERFGVHDARGGAVTLRVGKGGFAARLDGSALTIETPFQPGGSQMDASAPPADPNAASTDALLRDLPVELVCELGRVTMTGREVLELRPGAVIAVGRPLAGPVDLSAGGRVVARGELVDVEGEIGVRIMQICE